MRFIQAFSEMFFFCIFADSSAVFSGLAQHPPTLLNQPPHLAVRQSVMSVSRDGEGVGVAGAGSAMAVGVAGAGAVMCNQYLTLCNTALWQSGTSVLTQSSLLPHPQGETKTIISTPAKAIIIACLSYCKSEKLMCIVAVKLHVSEKSLDTKIQRRAILRNIDLSMAQTVRVRNTPCTKALHLQFTSFVKSVFAYIHPKNNSALYFYLYFYLF
jgi:hypothetical protein